ncbi:hypothetical protein Dimus_011414 [Dionaea muscipula]
MSQKLLERDNFPVLLVYHNKKFVWSPYLNNQLFAPAVEHTIPFWTRKMKFNSCIIVSDAICYDRQVKKLRVFMLKRGKNRETNPNKIWSISIPHIQRKYTAISLSSSSPLEDMDISFS